MAVSDRILILSALVLLVGGSVTGVFMSTIRAREPEVPKYLAFAHQAAFIQAPLLVAVAYVLSLSPLSPGFHTVTAGIVSGAALLLFAKDVVNWRTGVRDEFSERHLGYRLAVAFGPLHLAGLVLVAVAVMAAL